MGYIGKKSQPVLMYLIFLGTHQVLYLQLVFYFQFIFSVPVNDANNN